MRYFSKKDGQGNTIQTIAIEGTFDPSNVLAAGFTESPTPVTITPAAAPTPNPIIAALQAKTSATWTLADVADYVKAKLP